MDLLWNVGRIEESAGTIRSLLQLAIYGLIWWGGIVLDNYRTLYRNRLSLLSITTGFLCFLVYYLLVNLC